MKKILKILVMMAVCLGFVGSFSYQPVYAADKPKMNVLKMCEGEEGREAVICVLKLVVTVLSYGIGILGTIGVVITGIQYISSQGDPPKMTKAKNRLIQIVIGLVVYAVMFAALKFLVPGFNDLGVLGFYLL